jgi:hypothetical protein
VERRREKELLLRGERDNFTVHSMMSVWFATASGAISLIRDKKEISVGISRHFFLCPEQISSSGDEAGILNSSA